MDNENKKIENTEPNLDQQKPIVNISFSSKTKPKNIGIKKKESVDVSLKRHSVLSFLRKSPIQFGKNKKSKDLNNPMELIQFAQENFIKNKVKKSMGNLELELDLSYLESLLDENKIKNLNNISDELKEILNILCEISSRRSKKEDEILFNFLVKNKIQENLKTDLIITDYNISQLYTYLKKYISGKIFQMHEPIYYSGEEADNIYMVLNGKVGMYELITKEEFLTCEEYYLTLCSEYEICEKCKKEGRCDINEYADLYLLYFISEENKNSFPLFCFEDILNLKKIILKVKIYSILAENKPGNIMELFNRLDIPLTFLNYDKLISNDISVNAFVQSLKKKFKKKDYFYLKLFGPAKHKVKLMKYRKIQVLKPFDFFGNFEMNNKFPIRKYTTRSESNNTILLYINKFIYSSNINNLQKNMRTKEIDSLYNDYFFINTQKKYFIQKIYSQFHIDILFKGNILFEQNEYFKKFIFVKEGIVELSLKNLSLNEFSKIIEQTKNIIEDKAKEFEVDFDKLIDFDDEIDTNSDLDEKSLQRILNQKQNFIFSRSEKGFFGDYEFFFNLPSFINGEIFSDKSKIYFYDFEDYKNLNEETYSLNQSLKDFAFNKMKNILKRMIEVYNSYYGLSVKKYKINTTDNNIYLSQSYDKSYENKKFDSNYKEEIETENNSPNKVKLRQQIILTEMNNLDFLVKEHSPQKSLSPKEKDQRIKSPKENNISIKKNKLVWLIRDDSETNHKINPSLLNRNYNNFNKLYKNNNILNKKSNKSSLYDMKNNKIKNEIKDYIRNTEEGMLSRNKTKSMIHNFELINKKNDEVKTVILPPISNKSTVQNHEGIRSMKEIIINKNNEGIPIKERLYGPKKSNSTFNDFVNNCNKIRPDYEKKTENSCVDMEEFKKIKLNKLYGMKAAQIKAFKNMRLKNKNLWKIGYNKLKSESYNNDEDWYM